jgi:hypothetical protein
LVIGTAVADFFAALTRETNIVLRVIIQSIMSVRPWPRPVTVLGEKL